MENYWLERAAMARAQAKLPANHHIAGELEALALAYEEKARNTEHAPSGEIGPEPPLES